MRAKKSNRISIAAVLALSGSLLWAEGASGPFSEETKAELAKARAPEWVSAFTGEVERLQSEAPLPPSVFELTLGAVPARWLQEDPREAARIAVDASRQADVELRRGVPRAIIREEVRSAWRTNLDSGQRILLRTERREDRAMERTVNRGSGSRGSPRNGKPGGWGGSPGMAGGD
jgi:hypothetical protein